MNIRNADAACYQHIFNYAVGCDPVDRACKWCCSQEPAGKYRQFAKLGVTRRLKDGRYVWNGHLWIADPDDEVWLRPQRFPGRDQFIFVNLLSDVCHEKIPTPIIRLGFDAIAASRHFGMHCTKRCERMAEVIAAASADEVRLWQRRSLLGFTAPGQPEFDERWPLMRRLAEQGWMVYGSFSPLLGPIVPPDDYLQLACWTIVSGEQGDPKRVRDMRPEWAIAILDKCDRVGMPFFFREMSDAATPNSSGLVKSIRKTIPNVLLRRDFPALKSRSDHQPNEGAAATKLILTAMREGSVNLRNSRQEARPPDLTSEATAGNSRIISLRGTHGSGKSTIVRSLLDANDARPIYGALGQRPEAYEVILAGKPAFIIGPYNSPCGGCDAVQPYALIPQLIEKYASAGSVIFEGALISSCWGAVGQLLERWGREAIVAFLATSVDECIRRVEERRAQRCDARPFDPKNLIHKFEAITRLKLKLDAADIVKTVTISDAADLLVLLTQAS